MTLNEHKVLVPELDAELDNFDLFLRLTEEGRRERELLPGGNTAQGSLSSITSRNRSSFYYYFYINYSPHLCVGCLFLALHPPAFLLLRRLLRHSHTSRCLIPHM